MFSKIGIYNLKRDKNVLGKKWFSVYRDWFSDNENIQMFIDAVKPHLPKKELDILYVASASGLLGESLINYLGKGKLTLLDISQEHLNENKNRKTKKICADLLETNLNKKFDVIIMRSSLDYFPSKLLQIKVLKICRTHLKKEGLFINQLAYISNINERDLISDAYNLTDKIGNRFFQSSDLDSIYEQAGFDIPAKVGKGKVMNLTEQDHIKRYGLNAEDVKLIQSILKEDGKNIQITKEGYKLKFKFPIFLAKRKI